MNRNFSHTLWRVLLAAVATASSTLAQNAIEYKFTNKNTVAASDLHVEFDKIMSGANQQTPANTFMNVDGAGSSTLNFANGVSGQGVAGGASVAIQVQYGPGVAPQVTSARWTQENTTVIPANDPTWAGWLGPKLLFDKLRNEWAGILPAAGDGVYRVTIDDVPVHFHTHAGDTPSATAARFANFIQALPWGEVASISGASVEYFGRSLNHLTSNTGMQILQQDSAQPVSVTAAPSTYGNGKVNSLGCVPAIVMTGTPSASNPTPFEVRAVNELNQKSGLMFYGFAQTSLPFQGGTMLVQPPVFRTPLQWSNGSLTGDDCSGSYVYDFNARIQSGVDPNLVAGTEVFCQFWSRDPASQSTTALSNGGRFTIQP